MKRKTVFIPGLVILGFIYGCRTNSGYVENHSMVLHFDDGEISGIYTGELSDGNPKGKGTFEVSDKSWIYEGTFRDGLPDGEGTTTWSDTRKYVGQYTDGKKNGTGVFFVNTEQIFNGTFKNDLWYEWEREDADIYPSESQKSVDVFSLNILVPDSWSIKDNESTINIYTNEDSRSILGFRKQEINADFSSEALLESLRESGKNTALNSISENEGQIEFIDEKLPDDNSPIYRNHYAIRPYSMDILPFDVFIYCMNVGDVSYSCALVETKGPDYSQDVEEMLSDAIKTSTSDDIFIETEKKPYNFDGDTESVSEPENEETSGRHESSFLDGIDLTNKEIGEIYAAFETAWETYPEDPYAGSEYEDEVAERIANQYGITPEQANNVYMYVITYGLPDTDARSYYSIKHGDFISATSTGNVLVIKAKIDSNLTNSMTVEQNYFNIADIIRNQGGNTYDEIQYWAVADTNQGEIKVISFTLSKETIDKIDKQVVADNQIGDYAQDLFIIDSLRR